MNPVHASVLAALAASAPFARAGAASNPAGAPATSGFEWVQPIDAEMEPNQLYRVLAPGAVFDGCRGRPDRDLRVVDASGRMLPFFLFTSPADPPVTVTIPARMLNRSRVDAPERYARIDIVLPDDAPADVPHNAIRVAATGDEWIRKVEILGGDADDTWAMLGTGYIVRHRRDVRVDHDLVAYPPSTFRKLQVRVHADPRIADDPVGVDRVDLLMAGRRPVPLVPVEWSGCECAEEDRPAGWQTVAFDTGGRNRPLDLIAVAAAGEYIRPVAVFTRNDTTGRWERAGSGQIQQVASNRQDRIELSARGRYWRIDIHRGDDAPLADLQVVASARPRWLVFESRAGGRAQLFYGADEVLPPTFDLARRTSDRDILSAPKLPLGAREANPLHKPRGPGERLRRSLVTAGVGVASLVVLVVILRMLRETAGPDVA
ncbi:MAG: DUF3999 domain-containing protein [Lentisphaerae bacterium]|nr:DUF3999 domain-containing protein [Lentisphaerota bacterium]